MHSFFEYAYFVVAVLNTDHVLLDPPGRALECFFENFLNLRGLEP